MGLSRQESEAVNAAIRAAEQRTDGEIVVIAANRSDSYHDVALHFAILAMLLALSLFASFPDAHVALLGRWQQDWTAQELLTIALVEATLAFLIVRALLSLQRLRIALTPRQTRARRVRRRAIELFRAGVERRTVSRSGVLLYLSLAEHRAEIVADAAIHAHVPQERWGEAMAALIDAVREGRTADGLVAATGHIGAILAETLPRTGRDPDELPDRIIEL